MDDYLFRGSLFNIDPDVAELADIEAERQVVKLILIPSESQAPLAVREALGSAFQNIYAEGYPDEETRNFSEEMILDYESRLAHFRRYSDPRYYKGTEYANAVEALARRRAAELFADNGFSVDELFVNVQALSGAPANNAVFQALVNPGDKILGMSLLHGGHLTHGSSVNRSGKYYNALHYTVDPETEKINYDQIERLALENKPRILIAGYSSYPWSVDWARLREIAKAAGSYLMADIAHVAGLVAAGEYPSPVGFADVITFTTHKSLCGPRGAIIISTDPIIARKVDRAVFPGEQGGPHMNTLAAIAVALKLAKSEQFKTLQKQIVLNCKALSDRFFERKMRVAFGGTNTHLLNLDVTTIKGPDGTRLSGDQAARILDLAGLVVNRNTIPGDKSAADPSGIRIGTPWVTQRGLREPQMNQIADWITDLLGSTTPYRISGRKGESRRAKVDFMIFEQVKADIYQMAISAGRDIELNVHSYPHFSPAWVVGKSDEQKALAKGVKALKDLISNTETIDLRGERVKAFLSSALVSDLELLETQQSQVTRMITPLGSLPAKITCFTDDYYRLTVAEKNIDLATNWLRDLSDGFVAFGDNVYRKLPGPIVVSRSGPGEAIGEDKANSINKPYYIGIEGIEEQSEPLRDFEWVEMEGEVKRTPIYALHKDLGAKIIPFAGWEMPVWYSSVLEEHIAVRRNAGLFDVAHMGVYHVDGSDAANFLDGVVGNDVGGLGIGQSLYTQFLNPEAEVIDDLLVYRRGIDRFLVVVNASNDDKDWAWVNSVKNGEVKVDAKRPWVRAFGRNVRLRNLRERSSGDDMRVDIALQGPRSRDILLSMGVNSEDREHILKLKRTELCDAVVGSFDLIVSRTGYTGENMAFELFVHPDRAAEFFKEVLTHGEPFGCKPIGLGARDSLRTEAGLPLYGHEMGLGSGQAGELDLGVAEAGFGSYVKIYKPWFIGREAYIHREQSRKGIVVRFRFAEKGVRMAHQGDPVMDKRGRVVGWVTSCAVDQEGMLTGQAYVDLRLSEENSQMFVYQGAPDKPGLAPAALKTGDRALLPTAAIVLSRFPKK